jgi:hypothetical protein
LINDENAFKEKNHAYKKCKDKNPSTRNTRQIKVETTCHKIT